MVPTWEEFVTMHAQAVLDSALRVAANSSDAEDVAQDVFVEIFRNGRLSEFAHQPALLRTMAMRRALDRLRRRKSTCELNGDQHVARDHEPNEYAIAAELDQRLRDELGKLPLREAEVFCLSVLEGNSSREVSRLLNISKGAVAKSLCMARARLSAAFGNSRSETNR